MADSKPRRRISPESLLRQVVSFYSASSDANGLPVPKLLGPHMSLEAVRATVIELVSSGRLEVVFEETDTNPHIQRLPRAMRKPFSELIAHCKLENACLYPSPAEIARRIDLSQWREEPYTLKIWGGGSHLDLVYFKLEVLERYRNDPHYRFSQDFFGGSISVKDKHYEAMPDRDHAFIQRFGIGYDSDHHWVIGVMLSYLRGLSASHQRIWREYEREDHCKLNEASFNAWFLGEWSEFESIFTAITEELEIVNKMCLAAFGKQLFKSEFKEVPPAFGILLRPTQREFNDFARALDLMLSENINKDFFPASLSRTTTVHRKDGTERSEEKGTLALLKEWIEGSYRPRDGVNPAEEITAPFRRVRQMRSKPSHKDVVDEFDPAFEDAQRTVLKETYEALQVLRLVLSSHPRAKSIHVPDWLDRGEIRVP